ncbi:MAG: sigma-70 family RNA polymerase sigma factor [Prevotella sp.]|nr:sigma-70 family RNA polymerase sigma factor [Staphylococcus sp.]MCM1349842.1 sigma-70 family RNA polymerase sigma factor [Prevotella sp.]
MTDENKIIVLLTDAELGINRLLNEQEEKEIFEIYAKNEHLREEIQTIMIQANRKLVYHMAKKYSSVVSISLDDLIQLGFIGISKAVDKFDTKRGTRFSSYATYWIKQSIGKGIEAMGRTTITQPNLAYQLRKDYFIMEQKLEKKYARSVSFYEVAEAMQVSITDLSKAFQLNYVESLDQLLYDGDFSLIEEIEDTLETPQEWVLKEEQKNRLQQSMAGLTNREQEVIAYRYGDVDGNYHSFEEVAKRLNISRQRAQVIEKNALQKMRDFFKEEKI